MAAISDQSICVICADPLDFTAFGVCNHKETCSNCVARWRFVNKDKTCMMCKTELEQVYIARYMGDFTARFTAQDFADLQARAERGELYHLPSIEGYTDDRAQYQLLKSLTGYTHPLIDEKCAIANRAPPNFTSLEAMHRFIQANYKLQFCNICVRGRKVFLCEQLLYNRFDLDRHNKTGDENGPMAESGFKGHPMCHFCRTRFYDSNELYRHMESSHEHCFICRRERPNQHVYYRHYRELEDHFSKDHFTCPHPACLEARFVVFPTEHEMKHHFANEHGDELKMSRAQRREMLTIPVNLQVRSNIEEEAAAAALSQPGVVIGGGYNLAAPRRGGGREGRASGMHHSSSEGQMQAALQASYEQQGPSSVMFDASDFPAVSGGGVGAASQFGRWSGVGGTGPPSMLNQDEFPELPGMSKAAKKKARQQAPLAAQLRAANMPVRVINRSGQGANQMARSASAGIGPSSSASSSTGPPDMPVDLFPQRVSTASGTGAGGGGRSRHVGGQAAVRQQDVLAQQQQKRAEQQQQQQQRSRKPRLPRTPDLDDESGSDGDPEQDCEPAAGSAPSAGQGGHRPMASPQQASHPASVEEEFPSLAPSTSARGRGARPPVPSSAPLHYEPVARPPVPSSAPLHYEPVAHRSGQLDRGGLQGAGSVSSSSSSGPVVRPEDFPSLGGAVTCARPLSTGQWQQKGSKGTTKGAASVSQPSVARNPPSSRPAAAPPAAAANGGSGLSTGGTEQADRVGSVSVSLKAANKALISKIRTQLGGDGAQFARFKAESGLFMRGELPPEQYHTSIVALGLLPVLAELASLCPVAEQRSELLRAHRAYLASPAANNTGPGWVPPEAAAAMAAEAEGRASWSCRRCTLVNAPEVGACEVCGATREGVVPALDEFPRLPSASSTRTASAPPAESLPSSSASKATGKKGKGGTKITIGIGAGNARAAAEAVIADPNKQPAWSNSNHNTALRKEAQAQREALASRGQGNRGQWSQSSAGNLARQIGLMEDAWGSR